MSEDDRRARRVRRVLEGASEGLGGGGVQVGERQNMAAGEGDERKGDVSVCLLACSLVGCWVFLPDPLSGDPLL